MKSENPEHFEDYDPIEDAAVAWLMERDEGFAPGRAAEFERWRCLNPQHAAAVDSLEQTWEMLEELPVVPMKASAPKWVSPTRPHRFRATIWVGLAAAALVMLAFGWWGSLRQNPHASYVTVADALERINLPDGSIITLNACSAASVDYSRRERRVRLTTGEAHFEVAHDESRPFLVTAGDVTVRAVGTSFNVRVAATAIEVVVASGKVRLDEAMPAGSSSPSPLLAAPLLEKGDRMIVPRNGLEVTPPVTRLAPEQLREALAWQQEMLVFTETPLRDVIEQFNRHNHTQLRIGDADLSDRLIGGTFAASNVEAFVSLLERGGDLRAKRVGDHDIILHKGR